MVFKEIWPDGIKRDHQGAISILSDGLVGLLDPKATQKRPSRDLKCRVRQGMK